jgi:uncharacterized membrane protein (DUF485 family)
MEDQNPLDNPAFRKLLAQRSRLRWVLSGILLTAYFLYAVGGLYFPQAYAARFMGSSVPWGIVAGYLIIAVSIAMSIVYVRMVNRLEVGDVLDRSKSS